MHQCSAANLNPYDIIVSALAHGCNADVYVVLRYVTNVDPCCIHLRMCVYVSCSFYNSVCVWVYFATYALKLDHSLVVTLPWPGLLSQ